MNEKSIKLLVAGAFVVFITILIVTLYQKSEVETKLIESEKNLIKLVEYNEELEFELTNTQMNVADKKSEIVKLKEHVKKQDARINKQDEALKNEKEKIEKQKSTNEKLSSEIADLKNELAKEKSAKK